MDDAGDGTRWMLYSELAKARNISKASATRLAFRKGWPRRTGNDGQARVAVPSAAQVPTSDATHDDTPGNTHAIRDDVIPDVRDDEALQRERQRADHAEGRADKAEAREAELHGKLDRQGRELTASLLRTAIAETEARTLREALDEARRPAWRRWLGLP